MATKKKSGKKELTGEYVAVLRKKLKLTQEEFWNSLGCTQCAGSRYENGQNISKPIKMLIRIIYLKEDIASVSNDAFMLKI